MKYYKNIIVGAGAAGLYCASNIEIKNEEETKGQEDGGTVILEKTNRIATKLLMSGNGQCNVTHGGSIKDFPACYGTGGKKIRGLLQKHSNVELCKFLKKIGVDLIEREDGKVFPRSLDSRDVLKALLGEVRKKAIDIKLGEEVVSIERVTGQAVEQEIKNNNARFIVKTLKNIYICTNLVIATGGCSYPTTGSDGKMLKVLEEDMSIIIEETSPALTPVYVEDYPYKELSGISFTNAGLKISDNSGKKICSARGDLLLTFKNFSGPIIINNSRYMKPGMIMELNFLGAASTDELLEKFKREFPGNRKSPQNYLAEELGLPKRFASTLVSEIDFEEKGNDGIGRDCIANGKVSQLTGKQLKLIARSLTAHSFIISGLAGFKEAMVTKGGVALDEINLSTMESKVYPGLYFIGETVNIDGDTGGYNLQFAYSSAKAVAEAL